MTVEEIKEWTQKRIAEIQADARFHDDPANVVINAPLALIQTELGGQMQVLNELKKLLESD